MSSVERYGGDLSNEELRVRENTVELSERDKEAWALINSNVERAIYLTKRINDSPKMFLNGRMIHTSPHKWRIGGLGLRYEEKRAGAIPVKVDERESAGIIRILNEIDDIEAMPTVTEFNGISFYKLRNFVEYSLDPDGKLGITLWDADRDVFSKTLKRSEYAVRINDTEKMLLSKLADRTIKSADDLFSEVAL